MPNKSTKSKSNRKSLGHKYKVLKKVRQHHTKKRKEAKKLLAKGGSTKIKALKSDPGIPSKWPMKDELVKEMQMQRMQLLAREEQQKEERKAAWRQDAEANKLAEMQAAAEGAGAAHDSRMDQQNQGKVFDQDHSRRSFFKEFRKVVEAADVILEVLDARDPLATRCPEVERYIRTIGAEKRVILLLNKIDLVPKEVAESWLKYLRAELPTVPFKCSTQQQSTQLGQKAMRSVADADMSGSASLGAEGLVSLLKNYARSHDIKTSISVGVIGLPNVGKSSLINSLKRTKVANVGNAPGVTKCVQEITLDKNIKLLDCPGIVFTNAGQSDAASALRNCVKVERLEDPSAPCQEILNRVPAKKIMQLYRIPAYKTVEQFLAHVAKTKGRLKQGGVPDILAAGRMVLMDWNSGKIPYYTTPPERENRNINQESAQMVDPGAAAFNVDQLEKVDVEFLAELPSAEDGNWASVEGLGGVDINVEEMQQEEDDDGWGSDAEDDMDEDDEVEDDDEHGLAAAIHQAKQTRSEAAQRKVQAAQAALLYGEEGQFNPKKAKAEKKRAKKAAKKAPVSMDEDFDFDEDFDSE